MSFGSPSKNPRIGGEIPGDTASFNAQGGPGAEPAPPDPPTIVQQHWCCIKGGSWSSWVNPQGMGHMEWDARWHCKKCIPLVPPVCPGGSAGYAGGPPPPQTGCNWKTKQECLEDCRTPDITEADRRRGGCFVVGTEMTMEDHSKKKVEDIVVGDMLHGQGEKINKVEEIFHPTTGGRNLVSINGGDYFCTEDHPFMTSDGGWKVVNVELSEEKYPELNVSQLGVGDTIEGHYKDPKSLSQPSEIVEGGIVVETIDTKEVPDDTSLWNFGLDGDHTYIADDHVMHNKGGGGNGGGGGKGQCKDFPCMKNGGGGFGIGQSTFDEDAHGNLTTHGKTQQKFMRALMRPESVMDAVDCNDAGQPEGCVEGGLYGLRGDPPNPGTLVNGEWRSLHPHNRYMEGTAKGCLQIRQPYHWDALEYWGGTTKTCPERFDYPDPEETDGKPEGFAWLESYEVVCKKYWMGLGGMLPPAEGSYANNRSDLSIPPGSYPMPYTNPDNCTTHPTNAGWSYPHGGWGTHSYRYRPSHSTHAQWNQRESACDFMPGPSDAPWVNPRTGEAGEQYPRTGDGALSPPWPRHWVVKAGRGEWTKDCACSYSQWVASMYMQRYTAVRVRRGCLLHHQPGDQDAMLSIDSWGSAATFAPATLARMHHLGGSWGRRARGARDKYCEPANGWDSLASNESEHQKKAMWQWVAEHCGEADAAAQATSPCRAAAVTAWHANEIGNTAVSYSPNAGSQGGAW